MVSKSLTAFSHHPARHQEPSRAGQNTGSAQERKPKVCKIGLSQKPFAVSKWGGNLTQGHSRVGVTGETPTRPKRVVFSKTLRSTYSGGLLKRFKEHTIVVLKNITETGI